MRWARARRLVGLFALVAGLLAACVVEERRKSRFDGDGGEGGTAPASDGGAGGGGASGGSGGSGGSAAAAGSAGTAGTAGTGGCSHAAPNDCLGAQTLEPIAGDDGTDLRVAQGTTSMYLKVFVAETVSSAISFPPLQFTARLDNSPGMDFDLYAYDGGEEPTCGATPVVAASDPAVIIGSWPDQLTTDDGRWFVFRVEHQGGEHCGSAAEWTLTLAGNYAPECTDDSICDGDDHCVCPDCWSDADCNDPGSCEDDGECETESEGCDCADCEPTPYCL